MIISVRENRKGNSKIFRPTSIVTNYEFIVERRSFSKFMSLMDNSRQGSSRPLGELNLG